MWYNIEWKVVRNFAVKLKIEANSISLESKFVDDFGSDS